MSEPKFTPAEWYIEPHDDLDKWIGIGPATLAKVDNDDVPPGVGEANARLLVTAPEFYAFAEMVAGLSATPELRLLAAIAEKLLAKARGEKP